MGWTTVSEIWLFVCLVVAVIYPIVDGREILGLAAKLAWKAIFQSKQDSEQEVIEISETPVQKTS